MLKRELGLLRPFSGTEFGEVTQNKGPLRRSRLVKVTNFGNNRKPIRLPIFTSYLARFRDMAIIGQIFASDRVSRFTLTPSLVVTPANIRRNFNYLYRRTTVLPEAEDHTYRIFIHLDKTSERDGQTETSK